MKALSTLLLILLSALSISAAAAPVVGTIEDVMCGEINPYIIGDACIVYTTDEDTGSKLGLVYGDYDWLERFVPSDSSIDDMVGDRFQAKDCRQLRSSSEIRELKKLNSEYFYLTCDIEGFKYFYGNVLY